MGRRVAGAFLALILAAGCGPSTRWIFPTPAPLPDGAVPVPIRVAPIPESESGDVEYACPAALFSPMEMVVDRSVSPPGISYRSVSTGDPILFEWSWGISAYELDGVVHIVAPDGEDLMVEGMEADDIGGGAGFACDVRSLPRRASP